MFLGILILLSILEMASKEVVVSTVSAMLIGIFVHYVFDKLAAKTAKDHPITPKLDFTILKIHAKIIVSF